MKKTAHAILERFVTDGAEHELVTELIDEGSVRRLAANADGHISELHVWLRGIDSLDAIVNPLKS